MDFLTLKLALTINKNITYIALIQIKGGLHTQLHEHWQKTIKTENWRLADAKTRVQRAYYHLKPEGVQWILGENANVTLYSPTCFGIWGRIPSDLK